MPYWWYRWLDNPKPAARVGAWPQAPTLFLPVTWGTLPFLYGISPLVVDRCHFEGSEAEIEQALNTLREQLSEPPRTLDEICPPAPSSWGAQFRALDGRTLEEQQAASYPAPPWEFRTTRLPDGTPVLQFREDITP